MRQFTPAVWPDRRLSAAESDAYFASSMKDAHLPGGAMGVQKFKGKVIEHKPARNPKEIVLGISDATTPENRTRDIRKLTAGTPLIDSGLAGPVRLVERLN